MRRQNRRNSMQAVSIYFQMEFIPLAPSLKKSQLPWQQYRAPGCKVFRQLRGGETGGNDPRRDLFIQFRLLQDISSHRNTVKRPDTPPTMPNRLILHALFCEVAQGRPADPRLLGRFGDVPPAHVSARPGGVPGGEDDVPYGFFTVRPSIRLKSFSS